MGGLEHAVSSVCPRHSYNSPGRSKTCYVFNRRVLGDLEHASLSVEEFWETWNMSYLLSAPDVPTAPQGPLEVSDITADSVILHWKPPKDDGGIDLTGYIIERRDAKRAVWTKVGSVDGVTLDFKVTGLQEGMEYLFRVSAENEVGISEPLERDSVVVPKSPFGRSLPVLYGSPPLSPSMCVESIAVVG